MCSKHSFLQDSNGNIYQGYGITDSHSEIYALVKPPMAYDSLNRFEVEPSWSNLNEEGWTTDLNEGWRLEEDTVNFPITDFHRTQIQAYINKRFPTKESWEVYEPMWAHLNNLLPYSLDGWRNAMNEIKPLRKVSTREYKEIKTKVNEYLENAFLFTHGDQQFNMKITAVKTGFCNPYESLRSHESETIYRKLDKIWGNLNTPDRESIRVNVFDMWSSLLKKHVVNHSYDIINRLEDMLIEVFLGVDVRDSVFYPLIQLMQQGIYVKEITTEGKVYIETTTTQKQ